MTKNLTRIQCPRCYGCAKSEITVTPSTPGITLTLESTGVFLGILVSVSALAGVAIKIISKMNHISISITQLQENLNNYANSVEQVRQLDKKFDIHLQDYLNNSIAIANQLSR